MAPGQIPVLVVGAGPTGLAMAVELARRGVVVRLIEQVVEPRSTSRALVVQSRTPALHTTYPRALMLPQDQTEQILTDHLSGLGVVIERGLTLKGLVQREDAVQAQLRHHDGRQESVAARWLIGADGAHSRVRWAAGIPFPGAPYAEEFIQADARLDWGAARRPAVRLPRARGSPRGLDHA